MKIQHVVSVSGGKDSTATLLLAQSLCPEDSLTAVFADTGNEHEATYEYLAYLEARVGVPVVRLKEDFAPLWWRRRDFVRDVWPLKGVSNEAVLRALAVLEAGPTGNPYLDLCVLKGRFPSRKAQFCTQYLKTEPLVSFQLGLVDAGNIVWSWQGVRRDESASRANAKIFEDLTGGIWAFRPIAFWTALETVEYATRRGVRLNPLYKQGMSRVGCMPCINASKAEIAEIARRFPEHIDRIFEWEAAVSAASRRGDSSFFPDPDDEAHLNKRGIRNAVRWAKTFRGGKTANPEWDLPAPECKSAYGQCE